MRFALLLLVATLAPHSGVVKERTGPEPSDIALVAMAAGGLWFARARLKARHRKD
jgi:hypothetical protein